ncbi:unnamed protein product [Cyprideis torosa]|uniref:Uncharacterized protein n=1 Tax=Cyprideis torosa TaxID=163714 RepID=A0A7R8W808_9CRUS|nr:unnamed protein product [Cyprideis torosa]CAG0882713.1 unnamed protein product [Cyprideis torosa]
MRQFKDSLNARWQLVQEDELTGIKIFQLQHQNGTLASLMANATSEHPPELFFKEFYSRAEQIPEWTDIVTISRKLKQVDPRTRVIFQNLKAKAPVPLADREFLILQRAEANFVANEGLSYTVAYRGIDYKSPLIPKRAPGVKRNSTDAPGRNTAAAALNSEHRSSSSELGTPQQQLGTRNTAAAARNSEHRSSSSELGTPQHHDFGGGTRNTAQERDTIIDAYVPVMTLGAIALITLLAKTKAPRKLIHPHPAGQHGANKGTFEVRACTPGAKD